MKVLIIALIASLSLSAFAAVSSSNSEYTSAKAQKATEPAPKDSDERKGGGDTVDPHQETYEGNDRGNGDTFDGGGYSGEGGGMGGEIFFAPVSKTYPVTTVTKTEDMGSVIVYTTTIHEDISAEETCTTVTKTVVEKGSGKVLSTKTQEFCNHL